MIYNIINYIISQPELTDDLWLASRTTFIGGSEISALFQKNKWLTDVQLFYNKIEPKEESPSIVMQVGKILEPFVKELYVTYSTNSIINTGNRIFRHPNYNYIGGTFDGIVVNSNEEIGILECKVTAGYGVDNWAEGIPEMYEMQCQYYMGILNEMLKPYKYDKRLFAHLAVLQNNANFNYVEISFDEKIFNILVDAAKIFWENNVLKNVPPTPVLYEDVKRVYKESVSKKTIVANTDLYELCRNRKRLREAIKNEEPNITKLKSELEETEKQIRLFMQDAEYVTLDNGEIIVSAVPDKNGTRRLIVKEKLIL